MRSGRILFMLLLLPVPAAACVSIPFDAPASRFSGEGAVTIEPSEVTASEESRLKVRFAVGASGLTAGGGFRVEWPVDPVHPYMGFTPPHTGSRHLRGHVQCSVVSGAGSSEVAVAWAKGRESGCRLDAGSLMPGDSLIMEYWALAPRVAGRLPLHVETRYSGGGGGRAPEIPPLLRVNPRSARALIAVLPGTASAGEPVTLAIVALDEFGNRAEGYRGTVEIRLGAARSTHEFTPDERGVAVLSGFSIERPGFARAEIVEIDHPEASRLTAVSNPVHVAQGSASMILWGDLHFHTGTGADGRPFMTLSRHAGDHRGNYTAAEDAYAHARDVMRLDFAAATEHAGRLMTDEAWRKSLLATADAHEPGRFTTFAAFQWKDRVVLLPGEAGPLVRADVRLTDQLGELRATLESGGVIDPVIMALGRSPITGETGVVEIYSRRNRGSGYDDRPDLFEPGASWAPSAPDLPIALAAGSDSHWGNPGAGDRTGLEPGSGGLTAVEAASNDRASILDALRQGRVWATTGARIHLRVAPRDGRLNVMAAGTAPFARIDLVVVSRGGRRVIPIISSPTLDFEGEVDLPRERGPVHFNVRAEQVDGEIAWSSLIPAGMGGS